MCNVFGDGRGVVLLGGCEVGGVGDGKTSRRVVVDDGDDEGKRNIKLTSSHC